jgi:hypothetical protein
MTMILLSQQEHLEIKKIERNKIVTQQLRMIMKLANRKEGQDAKRKLWLKNTAKSMKNQTWQLNLLKLLLKLKKNKKRSTLPIPEMFLRKKEKVKMSRLNSVKATMKIVKQ